MIVRAIIAFALLMLAGVNGLLAGAMETCTMNSPDSLLTFPITLALNVAGMALLGWKPHRVAVIIAAGLPAGLAVSYTVTAIELASGTPACTIITGNTSWQPSGEEAFLAAGWAACALIFWIGLATALTGGYRRAHDRDADHYS